ncbi:GXGXG motif-containing protein [Candidatus Persebacteraceae bacterium Df01]|jgi:glutamate synthase domain-containing protein 3|uniref:GXGXG motif-containing protein n=1 Tax=Candidatus Doriopsillibacter californiensis TaxID=2970740 RepID=A0ABT7QMW3_9GAMM|nr:GXGXG motif-containing protein [Candidatus Persebacteraceae bacterium Df01]
MAEELTGGALIGRNQQIFFNAEAGDNRFVYPDSAEVDFSNKAAFDASDMDTTKINKKLRALISDGHGHITIKNPGAKHSLAVGILNRLQLEIDGSLGYFGCGLNDGPTVRISGRVGWSCAENMMSGVVEIAKNAGSTFGAALRGGDLVCHGDVGGRTGICMKGGTIIVGGRTGAFSGFMMQRGRMIVLGDAGGNLGDTMYDGIIYVGGKIDNLGVDAVEGEMTDADCAWLRRKLSLYGMDAPNGIENMTKIVSGKQLWNYDNLEPTEKKIVL